MEQDRREPVPRKVQKTDLKLQVEKELVHLIKQMDLSVNTKLPREEELAKMLGVSRITLRSVLDELSSKGMIFRIHGKGTFVNSSFFEMKASLNPVMHFSDMIANSGYTPRVELLHYEVIPATADIAAHLDMQEGEKTLLCDKIFFADTQICAVTRDFIPLSYLNDADLNGLETYVNSVFYFMYKASGKKLCWDRVELDAVYSKDVELLDRLLTKYDISSRAFLLLKGVSYDEENTAAAYTWEYIDTTVLKFNQIRKRILHYEQI